MLISIFYWFCVLLICKTIQLSDSKMTYYYQGMERHFGG